MVMVMTVTMSKQKWKVKGAYHQEGESDIITTKHASKCVYTWSIYSHRILATLSMDDGRLSCSLTTSDR
jgi:hypothetical protein